MNYANSYAVVDLDAIRENFEAIKQRAGVPVMAVVKANAYGHGAVPVAKMLEEHCAFFGVSSLAEALELRRAGIQKDILLLGHTNPAVYDVVVRENVRPAIFCYEDALALSQAAVAEGKTARLHIAVDTGMSRIGFQVTEESADVCVKIAQLPGLELEGLFSHFATADAEDLTRTERQAERYAEFDRMLQERGIRIPLRHLDNSAGLMNYGSHYQMVRAGIVLYGLYPSEEVDKNLLKLRPAMSWHSRVSHVKLLEPGREISYGGTYVTQRPTMVATVPVGYADGYRRFLSNQFYVLIHGERAPILGRVCMDQMMVDVSHIPKVKPGDGVVLMGTSGDERISAETLGQAGGASNYEQVCNIGHRVPRVYVQNGERTDCINYLLDK